MNVGETMYRFMDGIEFLKSLPDRSVDGIFTDPPWKRKANYHDLRYDRMRNRCLINANRWEELLTLMTNEAARLLNPETGRCFIWLGMTSLGEGLRAVTALEYRFTFFVGWMPPRYVAGFELLLDPIVYFAPNGSRWPMARKGSTRIRSIYHCASTGKADTIHPCARPVKKVQEILKDCFRPGEYVIDPFAGSDTTGRAARELGLEWDSCEIDPKMYETGLERHRQGILFE